MPFFFNFIGTEKIFHTKKKKKTVKFYPISAEGKKIILLFRLKA